MKPAMSSFSVSPLLLNVDTAPTPILSKKKYSASPIDSGIPRTLSPGFS